MAQTNPMPEQVPFGVLAGHWTISVKLGDDGTIRASLGRLDMESRKMRWTPLGARYTNGVPSTLDLREYKRLVDDLVVAACARLRLV